MTKNEEQRLKLFRKYSDNLKLIRSETGIRIGFKNEHGDIEEPANSYICPICTKLFIEESINQNHSNPLTLEDVPPQKLGGKKIILTCKNCNNKLGGNKLDSKLIWDLEVEPFLKKEPNSHIKAYYEINKRTKAKGQLTYLEPNKYGISFNPNTNPNLKEEFDYLIKNWNKTTIKFSFQIPNKKKVHLAILRIAHLKMFSVFGYGYFLNPTPMKIAKQLMDLDKVIIPDFGIPIMDTLTKDSAGIHFITSPKELQSFLVIFNINVSGKTKTYSVFIPGPELDCLSLYSRLKEEKKYKLNIFQIPDDDYLLIDKKNILAYTEIWKDFNK